MKLSVVGPGKSGIWRRERIRMTEQELDDVAFLTGSYDVTATRTNEHIQNNARQHLSNY